MWGRDANPVEFFYVDKIKEWTGSRKQLAQTKSAFFRSRDSLWKTGEVYTGVFDIDNDVRDEEVYYENACTGYGSRLAILNKDNPNININATEKITLHPKMNKIEGKLLQDVGKETISINLYYKKAGIMPVSSPLSNFDYSVFFV